jgi:orotate phosphoribosyltransferase
LAFLLEPKIYKTPERVSEMTVELITRDDKIKMLIECGTLVFEETQLSDGANSPYYFSIRNMQSYPYPLALLANWMGKLRDSLVDRLAAIAMGTVSLVTIMSHNYKIGMLTIRDPKYHGVSRNIDGDFQTGMVVDLFDDAVTSGKTIIRAIGVLQSNGLHVKNVYVVMDREEDGVEKVKAATGCDVIALFTINEFITRAHDLKIISDEQYLTICRYLTAIR